MTNYTTANEVAELRENSGDPSYLEDAATYYDDPDFNNMLLNAVVWDFITKDGRAAQAYEVALLSILQHFIQYETYPDWIEPLIDRVAKERFDDSQD